MIKNFDDFQKLGQQNVDTAMKAFGEWNKGWQAIAAEITDYTKKSFEEGTATFEKLASAKSVEQAIAAEMTDYTKRSFEESTATFEKLLTAKSLEQAIEIQSGFAKRAYDGYMHQVSKIGGMYAELAKEAYKPVEKALQNGR